MKTTNRSTFNQDVSRIVGQVVETSEAVKVVGCDGKAVVVSLMLVQETKKKRWDRLMCTGLIQVEQRNPRALEHPPLMSGADVDAVMAESKEDGRQYSQDLSPSRARLSACTSTPRH